MGLVCLRYRVHLPTGHLHRAREKLFCGDYGTYHDVLDTHVRNASSLKGTT